MSYEASIVCDGCSVVIGASFTAAKAREENRRAGGCSRPPKDYCHHCARRFGLIRESNLEGEQ